MKNLENDIYHILALHPLKPFFFLYLDIKNKLLIDAIMSYYQNSFKIFLS